MVTTVLLTVGLSACALDDILPEKGNGVGSGVTPNYENTVSSSNQEATKPKQEKTKSENNADLVQTNQTIEQTLAETSDATNTVEMNTEEPKEFEKGIHSLELASYRCSFEIKDKPFAEACSLLVDRDYSQCLIDFRSQIEIMTCKQKLMGFQEALDYIFTN
jgi:hypothetical protein